MIEIQVERILASSKKRFHVKSRTGKLELKISLAARLNTL